MKNDQHIQGNVYLVYSPYEGFYYFEDRNPDNWRVSISTWKQRKNAIKAFSNHVVVWEKV